MSALPRASASSTAPSAPSAATSTTVTRTPPNAIASVRSAASMTTAGRQRRGRTRSRVHVRSAPSAGRPAARARRDGARRAHRRRVPTSQPTSVAPSVITRHLRRGDEQDLRPPGAEPREAPSHGELVAAQPRRREHREAEQQHRGVAAEDQQPLAGDPSGRPRRRDRVGGRGHGEEVGGLLEPRLRAVEAGAERGQLPRVDRAAAPPGRPSRRCGRWCRRRAAGGARTRGRRSRRGSAAGVRRWRRSRR